MALCTVFVRALVLLVALSIQSCVAMQQSVNCLVTKNDSRLNSTTLKSNSAGQNCLLRRSSVLNTIVHDVALLRTNAASGTATNGTLLNGAATNGTLLNGTATNGTLLNGTATNGTLLNGTATNGTLLNGAATNGTLLSTTAQAKLPSSIARGDELKEGSLATAVTPSSTAVPSTQSLGRDSAQAGSKKEEEPLNSIDEADRRDVVYYVPTVFTIGVFAVAIFGGLCFCRRKPRRRLLTLWRRLTRFYGRAVDRQRGETDALSQGFSTGKVNSASHLSGGGKSGSGDGLSERMTIASTGGGGATSDRFAGQPAVLEKTVRRMHHTYATTAANARMTGTLISGLPVIAQDSTTASIERQTAERAADAPSAITQQLSGGSGWQWDEEEDDREAPV